MPVNNCSQRSYMKIWHKSLIALGTIGVAAGSISLGMTLGYKDYQYKKHFGRGNFGTAIPASMANAPVYFASKKFFWKNFGN